jgi:flagellar motor component MotA
VNTFFGLPAHPLFVHLPVVLIPLGFVGVLLMVGRPSWWQRLAWPTVVVTALGTLGAIMAANSGEALEEAVRDRSVRDLVREHVEAGDMARGAAIVFFVVLVVSVFGPRFVKALVAKKWWRPLVVVAVVASGAFASWAMYDAGHSGAKSVWNEVKVTGEGDGD